MQELQTMFFNLIFFQRGSQERQELFSQLPKVPNTYLLEYQSLYLIICIFIYVHKSISIYSSICIDLCIYLSIRIKNFNIQKQQKQTVTFKTPNLKNKILKFLATVYLDNLNNKNKRIKIALF